MVASVSAEAVEQRKLRKKLQNRRNQRARRLRIKEQTGFHQDVPDASFEVHRWRLDEEDEVEEERQRDIDRHSKHTTPRTNTVAEPNLPGANSKPWLLLMQRNPQGPSADLICEINEQMSRLVERGILIRPRAPALDPPLSDRLLHLVQFNALRGFISNKHIIESLCQLFTPSDKPYEPLRPHCDKFFPGRAALVPTTKGFFPQSLIPTTLQTSVAHATWIDLLPFPRMRDNLIQWEDCFDHGELVEDIVGNIADLSHYSRPPKQQRTHKLTWTIRQPPEDEQDEISSVQRKGLILWGDPHLVDSWEITPGFISKWKWTVEGCPELLIASNRWRMRRGEAPLQLICHDVPDSSLCLTMEPPRPQVCGNQQIQASA